jgi:hypothetical protein
MRSRFSRINASSSTIRIFSIIEYPQPGTGPVPF